MTGFSHSTLEVIRVLGAACAGGVGGMAAFLFVHWFLFWRKSRNPFALAPIVMNFSVFLTMAMIVGVRIYLASRNSPLSVGDVTTWVSIASFAVAIGFQFRNLGAAQHFYERLTR